MRSNLGQAPRRTARILVCLVFLVIPYGLAAPPTCLLYTSDAADDLA